MPILVWEETEEQDGKIKLRRRDEPRPLRPYRLLTEDPALGYGEGDNLLIQGDNLEALQSLLPYYAGQVKCIFIDPPYNTGSAFAHYDDGLEHSAWLSMMKPRLELLRELLSPDGSIWVTIDDNEAHYLKVLMDMVFGRGNFVSSLAWHKRISPANDAKYFSGDFDHVLVYARSKSGWIPNRLTRNEAQLSYYKNPDSDPRGPWNSSAYTCAKTADERPNLYYKIVNPHTGAEIFPSKTRVWAYDAATHQKNVEAGLLYWGKDGTARMPRIKKFLTGVKPVVPRSIWGHEDSGHNQEARIEIDKLFGDSPFVTPKPERLLRKVLEIATNPNDIVLDSFLGSGTTAAVAHKMGRRWIGIEMGDHAVTHCRPRLRKVVDGEQGGISQSLDWSGGGGFRFYRLGGLIFDEMGAINPAIRFQDLAAHIWFTETGMPLPGAKVGGETRLLSKSPVLGIHKGCAYALFYNGVWGEECPDNTLSPAQFNKLKAMAPEFDGSWVIYASFCESYSREELKKDGIEFRQLPFAVKGYHA